MKARLSTALVCGLWIAPIALADVTMRSTMDYRTASFLPPAAADAMNKQLGDMTSNGVLLRIKGQRSVTTSGPLLVITDREKGTVIVVDPKGKRYATCSLDDYADKLKGALPQVPEAAMKALEGMKFDVKTDKTGKTATIKGIKAEEMLVTMSIDVPNPMGGSAGMKMEMHMWAATREELERVPALKELAAYMSAQAKGMDAASIATKMFSSMPGFGDKLKGPMEEMMKATSQAVLRTQVKMFMPAAAQAMGASDPNEAFTDLNTEVVEISTDPIADSVFQAPQGYTVAKMEELVQLMNPMRGQAQQQ